MADEEPSGGLRFTVKEVLLTVLGTALALGSLKAEDPWVVIPMLLVAAAAFVILCVLHAGPPIYRFSVASAIVLILVFIGWRDLRHVATVVPPTPIQKIKQTAIDSPCANQVAQSGSQIDCNTPAGKNDKTKKP
jgi:hypothetical protein